VSDLNPQAEQMADESMVRNLAAQADAIWPQERPLFLRYPTPERILDAGCGTGEITRRLAELFPAARLLGVDIVDAHLGLAAARAAPLGDRVRFEHRSIYDLGLPAGSFDLTVCRHVLQAIPHAEKVLAELARVTRPGGRQHLIVEDYGMFHVERRGRDPDEFWHLAPGRFGAALGTDMFIGRHAYRLLRRLGLRDLTVDYVVVDTLRVPRQTFAAIFTAWRDGYAEAVGQHTPISAAEMRAYFDDMIATIRDPDGYAVWHVPVVAGVV
jgi:SAM-dependent methyltransferase